MYDVIFYKRLVSSSSAANLIKWLHCGPFAGKRPTISENSREPFLLEAVLADVGNCGMQACNVKKWGIFELLAQPFLSEHFQKIICSTVFSSVVGCRLYLCICI